MARTVRFATTVTPLEAQYIRRLARQAGRTPQGWLYLVVRAHLLQQAKAIKERADA